MFGLVLAVDNSVVGVSCGVFTLGRGSNIPASPQSATNPKLAHPLHQRNYGKPLHQRLSGFYGMGENSIHFSLVITDYYGKPLHQRLSGFYGMGENSIHVFRVITGYFIENHAISIFWIFLENCSISVSLECYGKPLHQCFS